MGVPNNTALTGCQTLLRSHDAIILVVSADLFLPLIENKEIVDEVQKPRLIEHGIQCTVQLIGNGSTNLFDFDVHFAALFRVLCKTILFPFQIILLWGFDGTIAQTFTVITCHAELHGGKEGLNEHFPLIGQILPDAIGNRNGTFLQFNDCHSNAVQIYNQIRPFFIVGNHSNLFSNFKEVFTGGVPVNEIYSGFIFVSVFFDFCTVFQKLIYGTVGGIQPLLQVGGSFDQFLHCTGCNRRRIAVVGKPTSQLFFVYISICLIFQITNIVVTQLGLKEFNNTLLRCSLRLAYTIHYVSSYL